MEVLSWKVPMGRAEPSFKGMGGPDLLLLGGGLAGETGEQVVEVVVQAGDGPGTGIFPGVGEAAGGALAGGELDVDTLLPAVVADAGRHQDGPP